MSLTEMQIQRELDKAVREGRHAEAEQLRFLLAEVTGESVAPPNPGQTYTLQEGDDVFGISEAYLGGLEYVPDFLAANPDSSFTAGEEVVLPSVGGDANDEEDQLSVQLVELFETKGPPNDSWTAEDYALLEAVQAQVVDPGDDPGIVPTNNGGTTSGQSGHLAVDEENDEKQIHERVPAGPATIDLPAEDAEVIANEWAKDPVAMEYMPDARTTVTPGAVLTQLKKAQTSLRREINGSEFMSRYSKAILAGQKPPGRE